MMRRANQLSFQRFLLNARSVTTISRRDIQNTHTDIRKETIQNISKEYDIEVESEQYILIIQLNKEQITKKRNSFFSRAIANATESETKRLCFQCVSSLSSESLSCGISRILHLSCI